MPQLVFALLDNRIVHVDEVQQGKKCNCFCPNCKQALIAKKGRLKIHHFAHQYQGSCVGAPETALHQAAKSILVEKKHLTIPSISLSLGDYYPANKFSRILLESQDIEFDSIVSEKTLGDVKVDLLCSKQGHQMAIEIAVTHFCDEEKVRRLRDKELSTLEIDLSGINREISRRELEKKLITEIEDKYWLYSKKGEILEKRVKPQLESEYATYRSRITQEAKNLYLMREKAKEEKERLDLLEKQEAEQIRIKETLKKVKEIESKKFEKPEWKSEQKDPISREISSEFEYHSQSHKFIKSKNTKEEE